MLENTTPSQEDRAQPELNRNALISTLDLSYKIDGKTLLYAINIQVIAGEIMTVIGPNGAGKTTLLRLLLGLLNPTTGRINRKPGLRIGYVPQKFNLDRTIPLTVKRFLSLKTPQPPQSSE